MEASTSQAVFNRTDRLRVIAYWMFTVPVSETTVNMKRRTGSKLG